MTMAEKGVEALDNPIWHALLTLHADLAEGDALARRYPPAITPLAAIPDVSAEAFDALAHLLGPAGVAGLVLPVYVELPAGWTALQRDMWTSSAPACPVSLGTLELDNVGHWVQHEASTLVSDQLVEFLRAVKAA